MSDQPTIGTETYGLADLADKAPANGSANNNNSVEQEAVRAINQRIFETSLDLILVVDRKGNFIRVSPSSQAILGYHYSEMAGRSATEFVYPEDLDSTRVEMRMARLGHLMRNFDCRYLHKDGRIVPLAWTGVWSEPEQQHFFIGRDMTERLVAERNLNHSQRLTTIGQLTGGVAHDFNNLLTVIIGNLGLLEEQLTPHSEAHQLTSNALNACWRGVELVRQLLAFARRQPLSPKACNLNDLITGTMGLLRHTLGAEIEIQMAMEDNLWPAFADPTQIESALVNLAVNARDAMPEGGRLIIQTANQHLDELYVKMHPDVVPQDYVMMAVSDTGTGIPSEILDHVFEPFFTTKETGKGTGLGLSMVYGFVKQSRGHIKIYSEVGHGTTIRLYLPKANVTPIAVSQINKEQIEIENASETILLVEDNSEVRFVVAKQLKEFGYKIIEAGNGPSALDIIKQGQPIQLLFTDLVMPGGMNGVELAREVRKIRPDLKVLFTSGYAEVSLQKDDLLGGGALNILSKPYGRKDLAKKVRETLEGKVNL